MLTTTTRPAGEDLVRLTGAGVYRDGRWLVRGVDLAVRRGEIVTLIGPNGSGKSTTAKTALGIVAPSEGKAERCPGLAVGYVPQKLSIDWTLPLTVERFLSLTGRISSRETDRVLEATGIPHLRRAEMRNLSGGEFQRALLARAMARKPDLLVLDEPVQGVRLFRRGRPLRSDPPHPRRHRLRHPADLARPACGDGGDRPCRLPQRPCLLPGRADGGRLQRGLQAAVRRPRRCNARRLRASSRPHPSGGRAGAACRRQHHHALPPGRRSSPPRPRPRSSPPRS